MIIFWGSEARTIEMLDPHFCICGTTNSGKTLLLRTMMKSVFSGDQGNARCKGIIFDPKLEFYPILRSFGVSREQIVVLNPFDFRAVSWHVAADIDGPASALSLASVLVPETSHTNPFFEVASRQILSSVFLSLHQTRKIDWSLLDAIDACSNISKLSELFSKSSEGVSNIGRIYLNGGKTTQDILATLLSKLEPFRNIAELWQTRPEKRISFKDWVVSPSPSVLLLASDDANRAGLDPINRAIFERLAELLTGRSQSSVLPSEQTWIFLDELRLLGKLEQLDRLLLKGRSLGLHVVLAFQDIQGIRHVYGELVADEMIGQCLNIALLRMGNPATQTWAASVVGESLRRENSGKPLIGMAPLPPITYQPIVNSSIFRKLPMPTKTSGISGVFITGGDVCIHVSKVLQEEISRSGVEIVPPNPRDVTTIRTKVDNPVSATLLQGLLTNPSSDPLDAGFIPR
jgi:type IV secretory pathway TraG/TraD family ATPase VirD4